MFSGLVDLLVCIGHLYDLPYCGTCQIPIFEKGYEKDPAVVAKEAIQEATRNGSDVVLVDTAGRMQVFCKFAVCIADVYRHCLPSTF